MRSFVLGLFITTSLIGAENDLTNIRMPDVVLDAIRHCECLVEQGGCNPYVIRINANEDIQRALAAGYEVNGHIIRCSSISECSDQANRLIQGGITNLDLGPYQINYKYHPYPSLNEYFDHDVAREHTNQILTNLVKTFGYSWETLGRYHHFSASDRTRNERYYRKMYAYIYGNQNNAQGSDQ